MTALQGAELVVIGGGAVGCGVAYSLAKAGHRDVQVVERAEDLAQVTTSQGAGLCGQVRSTRERIELAMYSASTFRELEKDSEVTPDWHEVGSLRLALSEEHALLLRQLQKVGKQAGLETALIENGEAKRRWPLMDFRDVKAVLWCPSDGFMTPLAVARSFAHQARKLGVRFAMSTFVEEIRTASGRISAVKTNRGLIPCRYVINAAGAHAYHVAKLVGLEFPIIPVRHEYFVTIPITGLTPDLPCFRVPELTVYGRARDGGLLLGGWEPSALSVDPRAYNLSGMPPPVDTDWQVLGNFEDSFARLLPQARGLKKGCVGKGWPTFTPDGRFIIGESSRVRGFVMAGGCNAHGISGAAGIGKLLVQSLFDSNPPEYVKSLSPDRFTEASWSWEDASRAAARVYETYYC
jgi:glycine/D-amino acid oxidase-like deaminating enzyme